LQSSFSIEVMGQPNVSADALVAGVNEGLKTLLEKGVTQAELDAARADLYTSVARQLEGLVARGDILNHLQVRDGDPNGLAKDLARYDRLTPETFLEAVKGFLPEPHVTIAVHPATAPTSEKGATR
jgi:predicted Zn-dependent peptidase